MLIDLTQTPEAVLTVNEDDVVTFNGVQFVVHSYNGPFNDNSYIHFVSVDSDSVALAKAVVDQPKASYDQLYKQFIKQIRIGQYAANSRQEFYSALKDGTARID